MSDGPSAELPQESTDNVQQENIQTPNTDKPDAQKPKPGGLRELINRIRGGSNKPAETLAAIANADQAPQKTDTTEDPAFRESAIARIQEAALQNTQDQASPNTTDTANVPGEKYAPDTEEKDQTASSAYEAYTVSPPGSTLQDREAHLTELRDRFAEAPTTDPEKRDAYLTKMDEELGQIGDARIAELVNSKEDVEAPTDALSVDRTDTEANPMSTEDRAERDRMPDDIAAIYALAREGLETADPVSQASRQEIIDLIDRLHPAPTPEDATADASVSETPPAEVVDRDDKSPRGIRKALIALFTTAAVGIAPAMYGPTGIEGSHPVAGEADTKPSTSLVDVKIHTPYRRLFSKTPDAGEIPALPEEMAQLHAKLEDAYQKGYTHIDMLEMHAQEDASNRIADNDKRDTAYLDEPDQRNENVDLGDVRTDDPRTNTALTETLKEVANTHHMKLPDVIKMPSVKDVLTSNDYDRVVKLAEDGHYPTPWWLVTAYYDNPQVNELHRLAPSLPAITPELRAKVDEFLDSRRFIELKATVSKAASDGELQPTPITITDTIGVTPDMLAPLTGPQQEGFTEPKMLSAQDRPDAFARINQPGPFTDGKNQMQGHLDQRRGNRDR